MTQSGRRFRRMPCHGPAIDLLRLEFANLKTSKKDVVEIAGIFAVVASLIFVGMQLQLDRKVALADQYFNRAESAKADRRSLLESDDYMQLLEEVWVLGDRPPFWDDGSELAEHVEEGRISVRSVEAAITRHQLSILGYDSVYYQYQQGLLNEDTWNGLRTAMKNNMARSDLARAVYTRYARSTLRPVIEEILLEIEAERESEKGVEPISHTD